MRIAQLWRYPVKGLAADSLTAVALETNGAISGDRIFAIAHGATAFDPASPAYLAKQHFLMLMKNARLAELKVAYADDPARLSVRFPDGTRYDGHLDDTADRSRFEGLLTQFIGQESRGGSPRVVSAAGHRFFDVPQNYLSLINLESVAELGRQLGRYIDPLRFRANLYVSGLPAWEETVLMGTTLACGDLTLQVAATITRCNATSVNPATAEVDVNVPFELRRHFDTLKMGLYLSVRTAGRLAVGSRLDVVAAGR